jgi:hypothetical protein
MSKDRFCLVWNKVLALFPGKGDSEHSKLLRPRSAPVAASANSKLTGSRMPCIRKGNPRDENESAALRIGVPFRDWTLSERVHKLIYTAALPQYLSPAVTE